MYICLYMRVCAVGWWVLAVCVPLTLLGCKVAVHERTSGGAYTGSTYTIEQPEPTCGGEPLQTLVLDGSTVEASAEARASFVADLESSRSSCSMRLFIVCSALLKNRW